MTEEHSGAKGHPTPKRKEAEAARKSAMKRPLTRKEQSRRRREARQQATSRQREALMGQGSAADLPLRDRGPARAMTRDIVDRRYSIAEFMLPILVVILLLSFVQAKPVQLTVFGLWTATIVLVVVEMFLLTFKLKRTLAAHFEKNQRRGCQLYGILRATQMRRFRLPKPTIARGEALRSRY